MVPQCGKITAEIPAPEAGAGAWPGMTVRFPR
jgi:hypothetical protein